MLKRKFPKFIYLLVCFLLIFQQSGFAQVAAQLDIAGHLSALHNSLVVDKFRPLHLRYLSYDSLNNNFKLLLDKGDIKNPPTRELENTSKELLKYFFIGISLPNDSFWVNLRPDAEDNIIDDYLAQTDIGKIMLESDLQLKKDTAKATSPETPEGREYWNKLYAKAGEIFGSENITIPTLTRPWIVPDEIIIRETTDSVYTERGQGPSRSAYVYKATLKVMLEQDYLKNDSAYNFKDERLKQLNEYSSQLIRELIIPKLTKEVNTSKRYAPLRQVYYSLILAQWFKARFYGKGGLYSHFINRKDLTNLISREDWSKTTYFQAYQKSFKDGEYNIKEPVYTPFGQTIRSYFSGGMQLMAKEVDSALINPTTTGKFMVGPAARDFNASGSPILAEMAIQARDNFGEIESISIEEPRNIKVKVEKSFSASSPVEDTHKSESLLDKVRRLFPVFTKGARKEEAPLGVQLEHFVYAQNRLAEQNLTPAELSSLLFVLGLNRTLTGAQAYQKIYERLSEGKYSKEITNLINADTYEDPRLGIEIVGQNSNPRSQGVLEAVANSLDALGADIGQFGKGVKQIIDWLEPTGEDRIDVFTRMKGGIPYQLTIIKDEQGQNNIQIREISLEEFQQLSGQNIGHGTVVRVTVKNEIPRTEKDLSTRQRNSQERLIESIHKRFPYVTSVKLTTQIGNREPQKVNGFEEKAVIVPSNAPAYSPAESEGKNIQIILTDHTVTITDNGKGMDAENISRMFVPKQGSKHPESLGGDKARAELKKVKVVQDKSLPHRVSFARNGEVVVAVDVPEDIQENGSVEGGLMVEFGSLMDVPESRDNIIIPLDLKPGEITNFERAVNYAISQIIHHSRLSNLDKVKYINTIIIGLDGLVKGNENYSYVVRAIRANTQKALRGIIGQLKDAGFIILPHDKQFEKLAIPEDKKALFMHEKIFDWQGAVSLKEIGCSIVPGITLEGEKHIPLVVAAFTKDSVKGILRFYKMWHTWPNEERLPIIKTNRFVAISEELGGRLNELALKRAYGLTPEEEKEFVSLLQLVNIVTAKEVATSYEVTKPKENMRIATQRELEKSAGEIDSEAINEFLTVPPAVIPKTTHQIATQVPADAQQRYVLLENGDLIEVGTGKVVGRDIVSLEPLRNGYYRMISEVKGEKVDSIYNPALYKSGHAPLRERGFVDGMYKNPDNNEFIVSPSKRYISKQDPHTKRVSYVADLETGQMYDLYKFKTPESPQDISFLSNTYSDLQFSKDEKYLTYIETDKSWHHDFVAVDLERKIIIGRISFGVDDYEYSINPFANVVFLQDKRTGEMRLIDLAGIRDGKPMIFTGAKALHTDSSGTYTAIIALGGEMYVYLHKSRKILSVSDFPGLEKIEFVFTRYDSNGNKFFGVSDNYNAEGIYYFNEDGQAITSGLGKSTGPFAFEVFDSKGDHSMSSDILPPIGLTTTTNPLQKLDQKLLYKHPHFDLFIDNSDPANPVAIDPRTDNRFPYKGEIVLYDSQNRYLQYHYNGEFVARSDQGTIGGITQMGNGLLDPSRRFAVYRSSRIPLRPYYFHVYRNRQGEKLSNIPLDHSAVYFDGKYFVFVNPKTGDVVYFDPNAPEQPVFISAQAPQTTTALTDSKPQDAPNRFVILSDTAFGHYVFDLKEEKDKTMGHDRTERINNNTFVYYTKNDFDIIRFEDSGVITRLTASRNNELSVLSYNERAVILKEEKIGGSNFVLDIKTGKQYPRGFTPNSQEISLSASGRFSVHKDAEGKLVYYDHNEVNPQPEIIPWADNLRECLVPKNADVVITREANNKYDLFSLPLGKKIILNAEHIEIDSSGNIAVFKQDKGRMSFINLKDEKVGSFGVGAEYVRVSRSGDYVYIMYKSVVDKRETVYVFTEDGVYRDTRDWQDVLSGRYMVPRFWEEYNLQEKTIWDRERGRSVVFTAIPYTQNRFVELENDMRLYGKILISWNKSPDWRITNLENPEAGDWYNYHYLGIDKYRLDSLGGGEVPYWIEEDGNIGMAASYGFVRGWINQSKTFILGMQKNNLFFVIDSAGDKIDITKIIPSGFIPTDVNGNYFVFSNPRTREIKYLDPRLVTSVKEGTTAQAQVSPESLQKQKEAIDLWNDGVLTKRDDFIAQARASYKPFLDLIPEEFKGEFKEGTEAGIKTLYKKQGEAITKRYTAALEGKELDLRTPLPFDIFQQRMQKIMLFFTKEYLETVRLQLSQEEYNEEFNTAYEYYANLFDGLVGLAMDYDIKMGDINNGFFEVLANNWGITTQEQIDATPFIARFISDLRIATGNQIKIAEIEKIIGFLSYASRTNGLAVIMKQLKRISDLRPAAKMEYLRKLNKAFAGVSRKEVMDYLNNPNALHKLGEARHFIVFLSNDVPPLKEKAQFVAQGQDIILPEGGISISQIIKLEQRRPKSAKDGMVMDMDYLIGHLNELPQPSETLEADILKNTSVQRESGAYAAEITQNSKDATVGMKGELIVDFYLQKNAQGKEEYVEEAKDNGTGALAEVALLIPKSTKAASGQIDLTGFFGTGKYTIFEGVDRVEIITRNAKRAYLFQFEVIKDAADKPTAIKIVQIKEVNDANLKQGVTVRRIKAIDSTIPELDQMLAQRSWKTFAGLSQNENFSIFFIDHEGKKQPLLVEKEVLTQVDFKALKPGQTEEANFGKLRIISAKDMPLQIVDKAGLRVSEIKEEYLALIPNSLRKFIQELGIIIQIPLPLIRNRSAFEHENEYLPTIQKYAAIEFYKAVAFKTLTQTKPQFVFEGFPLDWETNDAYWDSIDLNDSYLIDLAQKINNARYGEITTEELRNILPMPGVLDKEKKFLKVILQLEVMLPNGAVSLAARRIAIQEETNKVMAEAQRSRLNIAQEKIPKITDIPFFQSKVVQSVGIQLSKEQMQHPEKYAVEPQTPEEFELIKLALHISRNFGIKDVVLMNDQVAFAGAFKGDKVYLARSLARAIGKADANKAFIDEATDTIVHELGHFLERLMSLNKTELEKDEIYITELANFTHDAVGTFAEAMKYAAAVSLANHKPEGDGLASDSQSHSSSASSSLSLSKEIPDEIDPGFYGQRQVKDKSAYSAVGKEPTVSSPIDKTGGIDFRTLPIVTQAMSNLRINLRGNPLRGQSLRIDLDQEWQEIQKMIDAGIIPSTDRIKEYVQVSCLKGNSDMQKVVSCIADILRLEEERCSSTEAMLKDILVVLESGRSSQELKQIFSGTVF